MMAPTAAPTLRGARILQLTQRYPPAIGGVEHHVARIAHELALAGAHVEVVTTDLVRDHPFERGSLSARDGVVPVRRHRAARWLGLPHGLGIAAPGMLADALRARTDIFHAHAFGYFPTWAGRFASGLRRVPLIITPHSHEGEGGDLSTLYGTAVTHATLRGANRVVALTHLEAERLERWGADPARIRIIPNGIDLNEFPLAERPPTATSAPVILFAGRIYPEQKGLDTLVDAMSEVVRTSPARLRLAGEDWGGLARIREWAAERGIADRITATGRLSRSDLLAEYAAADVFVLPSHFDAFPFVLLEAMAAGLPIVASRVGGVAEVVIDGETGLLVPPRRPRELAEALSRLVSDPARARRLGSAGRERVRRYSWERIVPLYLSLYAEALDGGPT
jgi:glycosyltransferase involved in cell wall biosynthesis